MELEFVKEAFATNWISPVGPHIEAFEREFAEKVGARWAVALSSGTAALHLALRAAGMREGEEVFCSTLTFSASANPILYERGVPVFVDSERKSWNLDPELLEEALAERQKAGRPMPRAIIAVHLYGQCADLRTISQVCRRFGVDLIEDAAEALGAEYVGEEGRKAAPGTLGRIGIYSFNGNKIITTSGGGMLVTAEKALADKVRFWATQARDPAPHYEHSELGFNYRLSNVLAGIGRGQLRVLGERVEARRAVCAYYQRAFEGLAGIDFMPEAPWGRCTRWLTCVLIDPARFGVDREAVRLALERENIEARPVWKPMHRQPVFAGFECIGGAVADDLFARGLCLPSGSNLAEEDLERVVAAVRACYRGR